MSTLDSSSLSPTDSSSKQLMADQSALATSTDLARLSNAENRKLVNDKGAFTMHDLEIGGLATAATSLTAGALGGGYGLAKEGLVQVFKYPVALGLSVFGCTESASGLLKAESRYLATAGKFGVNGLAIGALIGASAFGVSEIKSLIDK